MVQILSFNYTFGDQLSLLLIHARSQRKQFYGQSRRHGNCHLQRGPIPTPLDPQHAVPKHEQHSVPLSHGSQKQGQLWELVANHCEQTRRILLRQQILKFRVSKRVKCPPLQHRAQTRCSWQRIRQLNLQASKREDARKPRNSDEVELLLADRSKLFRDQTLPAFSIQLRQTNQPSLFASQAKTL